MKLLLVVVAVCAVWPNSVLAFDTGSVPAFPQASPQVYNHDAHIRDFSTDQAEVIEVNRPDESNPIENVLYTSNNNSPTRSFDKGSVQAFPKGSPYHPVTRSRDKKLVCYFGSWSVYRSEPYDFAVTDIDPFSCTHIIYSFAGLDNTTWTIKVLDPELDIDRGAYKAAIGLKAKNPDLKVMIAIGGWAEGGKSYSDMVSVKERRDIFVKSVISFMEEHQWDGLDLDWEYPGSSDRDGRPSDKANFAALVSELSREFKPRGWLLTAAVTPARSRVDAGYDVARIARDLDYIFVMTYDLRGIWYGFADHHAPLSHREIDSEDLKYLNTIDGLNYWHSKGAPMEKLLMGIPFYSRAFTLSSMNETKPGSPAKSGSPNLDYYLLCQKLKEGGWKIERDAAGGPYMVKGDVWLGYDDTEYIETKMEVVHSMGLGGAFMWSVDSDDWLGECGTKWPLLTTMRKGLYGSDDDDDDDDEITPSGPFPATEALVRQPPSNPTPVIEPINTNKKLVCYFGSWSARRSEPYDFAVTDIDPFSCTHIIYSFAGLDNTTWTIKSLDPELDIEQGAYKAAIGLKAKNTDLKVMIAIGGWAEGGKSYSDMVTVKERRDIFVKSVIRFMEEHQWDGLDLDWEYPGASDRDGRPSDKANFAALVSELSAEFKPRGWLLTAAVSLAPSRVDVGYDVARLARDLDYIFVMTYDLRGFWYGFADHVAPLSRREIDSEDLKYINTIDGLNYWHSKGTPMHKLLMGIPFYARGFTLSSINETKPGSLAKSGWPTLGYYLTCQKQKEGGWKMERDSAGGPYMVKGDAWLGYDDIDYVETKMEVVHSMGLGGAFMWSIDEDDWLGVCGPKWPLLTTMRKGLYGSDDGITPSGPFPRTVAPVTEAPTTPPPMPILTSCFYQSDCPSDRACVYGTCVDPCFARCGPNAQCQVYNYQGYCTCSAGYTGNPYLHCYELGCTSQSDCPSNQACVYGTCVDPCFNRCGTNAKCQVVNYNYNYCICPADYTGNPYLQCSKIDAATTTTATTPTTSSTTTTSTTTATATTPIPGEQTVIDDQTEASTEESQTEISEPLPGSSLVTTTPATSEANVASSDAEFICSGSGYLRDESECSVYYLCDPDLISHKFVCPNGLYFDLKTNTCDWQHNVYC